MLGFSVRVKGARLRRSMPPVRTSNFRSRSRLPSLRSPGFAMRQTRVAMPYKCPSTPAVSLASARIGGTDFASQTVIESVMQWVGQKAFPNFERKLVSPSGSRKNHISLLHHTFANNTHDR